jgi:hypothetical protein
MKSLSQLVLGVFILLSFNLALAQTSTTTLTAPAGAPTSTSSGKFREVIKTSEIADPQIITDKKLQADEGALSRYSLKFGLSYSGPGIGDLSNKNQPNPDGVPSTNETKISGSISARYRIDGVSAVSLGTGISAIHPLHGWDRTDVNNPFLSYDRSSRWQGLQVRNIISGNSITNPVFKKIGEVAAFSYEIDLVHNIGDSRFAAGLDTKYDYYLYDRSFNSKTDRGAAQNYLSFYPNMKYQVSDKLNLNSSLAIQMYNPRALHDRWAMWNRTMTQRVGVGYSYRRDVYFSPFLTIYPKNLKPENTTFNLAATFSVL